MDYYQTASLARKAQKNMPAIPNWTPPDLPQMPAMPTNVTQNITNYSNKGWSTVRNAVSEWNAPSNSQEIPPVPSSSRARPVQQQQQQDAETQGEGMWLKVYGAVSSGAESLRTKLAGDDGYESDKDGYKGESHLCRIMKEYYIGKARHAQDLPSWLFPPSERPTIKSWDSSPSSLATQPQTQRSNSSSLKDIYDSAPPASRKESNDSGYSSYSSSAGSRAGERLRAMRDQRGNMAGTIKLNEARGIPGKSQQPDTRRRAWD